MAKPTLPRFAGGMNTLAPDYATPQGFVRDATNLDITNEGVLRTRTGFAETPRIAGEACHSLFATGNMLLVADGVELKRDVARVVSTVFSGLVPGAPVCYTEMPDGAIAFSDGMSVRRVAPSDASSTPLAPPAPGTPALAAVANGLLPAGTYHVAIAWAMADGSDSCPSLPGAITVAKGQAIELSALPVTAPDGAIGLRIFAGHANEGVLFEAAVAPAGASVARIDAPPAGRPLETLFEAPFPGCSALASAAGRLLGARGNALIWSEPFRPGVWQPSRNFIQFSRPVTLIAPTQDGVYVATLDAADDGETVFLPGFDFGAQAWQVVAPYGAYPGTLAHFPYATQMGWASPKGLVVAGNGGEITNISLDRVKPPSATRGASVVRESGGMRQIITSLRPGPENHFATNDFAEAEVIKGASNNG